MCEIRRHDKYQVPPHVPGNLLVGVLASLNFVSYFDLNLKKEINYCWNGKSGVGNWKMKLCLSCLKSSSAETDQTVSKHVCYLI